MVYLVVLNQFNSDTACCFKVVKAAFDTAQKAIGYCADNIDDTLESNDWFDWKGSFYVIQPIEQNLSNVTVRYNPSLN